MSTHPTPHYVSYLLTDVIVTSLVHIDRTLTDNDPQLSHRERIVLEGVRQDLLVELRERQLVFELHPPSEGDR